MGDIIRFIRRQELRKITGKSMTTIYRDIAAGRLPKPYQIGPRSVGWREDELLEYLQALPRAGTDAVRGTADHTSAQ